ncbi:MAG TPA: transposase [Chloroflexi bacterium]|nr:transposase [Chloroflexota bacterium]
MVACAGVARWAWNWGLERRIAEYRATGRSSNAFEQHRQLVALKKTDYPWLYNYSKSIPQNALRDLDRAFRAFFRRLRRGEKPGFPRFKSRKRSPLRFRVDGAIRVEHDRIRLPRIGWLRLKERGYIPTDAHILSATVSERAGRWFVSVQVREAVEVRPATGEPLGVDLGVRAMAVLSDGRRFEAPRPLEKARRKLRRLQRQLARRKRGGRNYEKTRRKLARLYHRLYNVRQDALHKATAAIVARTKPDGERPREIVIEDLNVGGMLKNRRLARAISDVGFYEFRRQLTYKAAWSGSQLRVADRFFPSSKTCHRCGAIHEGLRPSDREWTCPNCGAVLDRDLNAAINLRNLSGTAGSAGTGGAAPNACGEAVRPATTPAASTKQEPGRSSP